LLKFRVRRGGMVNGPFTIRLAQWSFALRRLETLLQRERLIDVAFSEDVRWTADP
jgi:hypothetical protein